MFRRFEDKIPRGLSYKSCCFSKEVRKVDGEAARQRGALADRQEEAPVFLCGRCTGEIYADEFVFENRFYSSPL